MNLIWEAYESSYQIDFMGNYDLDECIDIEIKNDNFCEILNQLNKNYKNFKFLDEVTEIVKLIQNKGFHPTYVIKFNDHHDNICFSFNNKIILKTKTSYSVLNKKDMIIRLEKYIKIRTHQKSKVQIHWICELISNIFSIFFSILNIKKLLLIK